MLALLAAALLSADPDDHLLPEAHQNEPYERAVAGLLLTAKNRELQMLTIPSFRAEEAVFVTLTDGQPSVVAVRATPHVWHAMSALQEAGARVLPDGSREHRTGGEADAKALSQLKLDREVATAPLSKQTYEVLKRVWHRALHDVRPQTSKDFGLDGETYHFAETGPLAGQVWSPDAKSRVGRLVAMATAMLELARAPEDQRATLDAALRKQAEAWLR